MLPVASVVRVYHRLEARGEIRGGRFVAGISGEQFALPEAVGMVRAIRRAPANDNMISVSAADPLKPSWSNHSRWSDYCILVESHSL